ncbi:MAG: CHAT domain-containing protein, partial [Cyanobacteria bacterium P01_D01_bin.1]
MSVTFTFVPSQNQTFELRCEQGVRSLPQSELSDLIEQCEQTYYSGRRRNSWGQFVDNPEDLVRFGRTLYGWLDGREGWLRSRIASGDDLAIYLNLDLPADMAALNLDTQRVAMGLAHLPWELMHDGDTFVMMRMDVAVLPVRQVKQRTGDVAEPQNRPLRLLLMATAPDLPGIADLQYEQEEANILQATKSQNQTIDLVVEESGSLEELTGLVQSYAVDHFDVFHLTGHGFVEAGQPYFLTENAYGQPMQSTAQDLSRAFKRRWPRVVFLSGCHTGEVPDGGTVPSMAAALIQAGAPVVLGWARPVYDRTAIVAAEALYQSLATGASVEEAVQAAQQEMIARHLANANECSDWHLLRMYQDSRTVAGLVTPLRTKNREKIRQARADQEFLDENGEVKVVGRAGFVGRRRPLQRCLRAMRGTSDYIGVYIQGMGGLGKSTLAARICSRVRGQRGQFEQVVIVGPLDEQRLLNALSSKYERYATIPTLLNQPQVSLRGRLQNFFEAIENEIDQPLLLVLDDFEQNIPRGYIDDGSMRLTQTAFEVLSAICEALADRVSRLIVTCRYHEAQALPSVCKKLYVESLHRMSEADMAKKRGRLVADLSLDKQRAEKITEAADGNPRLMEWLTAAVSEGITDETLLNELKATEERFREDVLAQALLAALSEDERKGLARLSVMHLPVAVSLMPDDVWLGRTEIVLRKLVGLGLVEQSKKGTEERAYRVSRILEPLLLSIFDQAEWQSAYRTTVQQLYRVWWIEAESSSELQRLELIRLAIGAHEPEIAAVVGDALATSWYGQSRFVESLELCQQLLETFEDYRILGTIARSEVILGFVDSAITRYQKALDLCPEEDLKEKSATLHNMAGVIAQQGDIERALSLWQESLEIKERIGDVQGKAATLNNMAGVIAQQGDIERALSLWQESLEIKERIGDVQGKAA